MIIKFRSRITIFLHDLFMIPIAWFGAYWLRFNLHTIPDEYLNAAWFFLPMVILFQVSQFWLFGLYRGVWRFSSLPDLIRISKAVVVGVLLITFSLFFYNRLQGVPRSVLPLYVLMLLTCLSVPRLIYRFWKEKAFITHHGQRALIVGAGSAGELLARDLLTNPDSGFDPIIFVDDHIDKLNREIRGIRVVGNTDQIADLVDKWQIEIILLAIPSARDSQMRRIVERCEQARVPFHTLPSVKELLSGTVSKTKLRSVSIEDILGRDPVQLDWQAIRSNLQGKVILVTGGGGSIGSELCKQLANNQAQKLIIFDQCEFNLYKINAE